jgi:dCMP deaminase
MTPAGSPGRIDRPDRHAYYMGIALAVRRRANCLGSRVGAVLVLEDRVIATGYNGTAQGMPNCDEGGCDRCAHPGKYGSGKGYDVCICVHAELNALLTAARFGIACGGASVYTTTRPCFGCAKALLQAQVREVYWLHDWRHPNPEVREDYARVEAGFRRCERVEVPDDDAGWAVRRVRTGTAEPPPAGESGS